ncbi:hypothetical protein WR25_20874 [Diploscapter pachys]|uniref:Sphingosine-1-phosphate lyase 1 n=1 Tax=Diploscapter pachys TaxID=2018661 RepID=A0A2A2JPP9_9BILA|nr:hypothetical protein WR25_20874 [Diploscapter pachys]
MPIKENLQVVISHVEDAHECLSSKLRKIDPLYLVIGAIGSTVVFIKLRKIYKRSEEPILKRLAGFAFHHIRKLPFVKAKIDKELQGARKDILHSIHKDDVDRAFISEIPEAGLSDQAVIEIADRYDSYGKFDVDHGRVSGAVYTDRGEKHVELLTKIYEKYAFSNPLHPDVFPGARKMEAEVIRMVLNLYNAPEDSSGSLTTGGTESIIMACFAYRNQAQARGIENPVILCSKTAHAAFDKGAHLCGMKVRHVETDRNNRVDLRKLEKSIDGDVCVIVGSAPNYPSGSVDPILEISKLGQRYGIPVHVDACLGGFLIPFMEQAGFAIEQFDFRNPGVTSISCDTHKYGCTPKGSSIVMYRTKELHHFQYFSVPNWTGGIYATPTICGSRAGANSAVAWATLLSFGRQEYVDRCRKIVSTARKIADGIQKIDGIKLHGSPDVSVVAFTSDDFNIYAASDLLHKRGWNLNTLQNPNAIHICVTYNSANDQVVEKFLADVKEVVNEVAALPDKGNKSGTAALYGMAAQIPDKSLIDEMVYQYLDACYAKPPPKEASDN